MEGPARRIGAAIVSRLCVRPDSLARAAKGAAGARSGAVGRVWRVPAALPAEEIEGLRTSLAHGVRAEPHPFLIEGRRVRVKAGPLAGVEGILTRRKNGARFVLSVEPIQQSVAVVVDVADLEPL